MNKELSEILEICLITYNRASFLDKTLSALMEGPLSRAKINVIDNCSTDSTGEICVKYKTRHPHINIVRHKMNIGGLGNILTAMQMPTSDYVWFLCDDDILDFSQCDDLLEALQDGMHDLILVGTAPGIQLQWGMEGSYKELAWENPCLFASMSFLPSCIYRSSLVDSCVIQQAYMIGSNLFPHLAIAGTLYDKDASLYLLHRPVLKHGSADPYWWTALEFASHSAQTCTRAILDPAARKWAIYGMILNEGSKPGPLSFLMRMAGAIVAAKAWSRMIDRKAYPYRETVFESFVQILLGCVGKQKWICALCAPFLLVPTSLCTFVMNIFRHSKDANASREVLSTVLERKGTKLRDSERAKACD